VVEDHSGDLEVAFDPVGAKPGDFVITIGTSAARFGARRALMSAGIGSARPRWPVLALR